MSNRYNTELWTNRLIWTAVVNNLPHTLAVSSIINKESLI